MVHLLSWSSLKEIEKKREKRKEKKRKHNKLKFCRPVIKMEIELQNQDNGLIGFFFEKSSNLLLYKLKEKRRSVI